MEETPKFNIKAFCRKCFDLTKETISRIGQNKALAKRLPLIPILVVAAVAAGIVLAKAVNVFEINDGKSVTTVYSISKDADAAIEKLGLYSDDYKILKSTRAANKRSLEIERTFPVTILAGEKKVTVKTITSSVGEILETAGFKVDQYDMVEPEVSTVLSKKSVIDYVNIDYIDEQTTEVIPSVLKTVFSNTISSGNSYVTSGTDGLKTVNYKTKLVNGQVAEKTVVSEDIITKAIDGTKVVGTGSGGRITTGVAVTTSSNTGCYSTLTPASPIPLDENGVPTNYTSHITVEATAYTYTGYRTSTGKNPQQGYVAVNPAYIPYGTRMYIISSDGRWVYGYAEAADTGEYIASRPTNIDLFLETVSQCYAFGRRNIEVYFLP